MKIGIVGVKDALWGELPGNVTMLSPYVSRSLPIRMLRRFFSESAFVQGLIGNPRLKHAEADVLIVFDAVSIAFLKWLKKHNPDKRIILWYWNPVHLTIDPSRVPEGIEKWSYSHSDCETYGMRFNTQFCFPEKYETAESAEDPVYDVLFVGRDKGRAQALSDLKSTLDGLGLHNYFRIVSNNADFIPYSQLIELTRRSRCILDYCVGDEVGMSLRALEALCLSKKVITNNKTYVLEKYYHPQNVFILGKDDPSRLADFVRSPVAEIDSEIKSYYSFSQWLKRFEF